MIVPNIWKNKKCSKPPTRLLFWKIVGPKVPIAQYSSTPCAPSAPGAPLRAAGTKSSDPRDDLDLSILMACTIHSERKTLSPVDFLVVDQKKLDLWGHPWYPHRFAELSRNRCLEPRAAKGCGHMPCQKENLKTGELPTCRSILLTT